MLSSSFVFLSLQALSLTPISQIPGVGGASEVRFELKPHPESPESTPPVEATLLCHELVLPISLLL